MNIFFHELKANLKSLLIWSGIVVLFSAIGFSKFSAFYGNEDFLVVLQGVPPAVMDAMNFNAFNLTTVTGFFGIMHLYFSLILAISAAMWGSDIITKEERDKTVEFSLALPVRRGRLVTAKLAAVAFNCIVILLVTWGITLVNAQRYEPDAAFYDFVAISMLSFLFLQGIFLAVGIFLGCALKKHKRAGSLAVGILLTTYFLSILVGMEEKLDFLKYFTPFKYFDAGMLYRETSLELEYVLLSLAIIVVLVAGALFTYQKRDLYI